MDTEKTEGQSGIMVRRKVRRKSLVVFLPSLALMVALAATVLYFEEKMESAERRDKASHNVDVQAATLDVDIRLASSELAILSKARHTTRLWDDEGLPVPGFLADLTEDFLNVAAFRAIYDQVRLLDLTGMEIVRVDYEAGRSVRVPQDRLQNKKGRYYFEEANKLGPGEFYASPLDLNIEHGKIEMPLKPMIRLAAPVFDRHGEKRGIVLLNYLGRELLDEFHTQVDHSGGSQAMLLNRDGYWLCGPNPEDEWGFMYEDRRDRTFGNSYPEAWQRIKAEDACQFETARGLFTSRTVHPVPDDGRPGAASGRFGSPRPTVSKRDNLSWKVVSFTPSDALHGNRDRRRGHAVLTLALLAAISLFGSWRLARASVFRNLAEVSLHESEERSRSVTETASDAIICIDSSGLIRLWNPRAEEMFGHSEDEAVGRSVELIIPDRYREDHRAGLSRVLSSKESPLGGRPVELVGVCKDGREFPVELSLADWRSGEEVYFTGILRDATERHRAEEALVEAERSRVLVETAAAAAHEINQPLTVVLGMAELLLLKMPDDDDRRPVLDDICRAGERIQGIVSRMVAARKYATTTYVGDRQMVDFDRAAPERGEGEAEGQ